MQTICSEFVYFIVAATGSEAQFCKIGRTSKSPYKRLRTLQTGCPFPLQIALALHLPEGAAAFVEERLHGELDAFHIRGEWFRLTRTQIVDLGSRLSRLVGTRPDSERIAQLVSLALLDNIGQ